MQQQSAPAQPAATTTAEDRSQSFRPVEGGAEMQSGERLLVEAYAAIWAILFVFLLLSWRRQKRIDRRIDRLESAIAQASPGAGKAG
jgi:CcmD family protein